MLPQKLRNFVSSHPVFSCLLGLLITFRLFLMQFLDLIDDEAYHWTWAKNLDWSYFDHPGFVAWMGWPLTTIFGSHPFVIRTPGFLIFISIVYLVYRWSYELFRNSLLSQTAAIALFFVPLWGFASIGTLPDVPLGFFWLLSAYIFWQGVREDSDSWSVPRTWITLGVVMGLGMNSKLTCCLVGLGMGLFLILSPKHRKQLLTPWPYLGTLITFTCMLPIFFWNANHDWAMFRYQFQRRHTEDFGADWGRWFGFLGTQAGLMSPGFYLALILTWFLCLKFWKDLRIKFLWCLSTPALLLFYYQPLWAAYKPHWSGPSYLLLMLAGLGLFFSLLSLSNRWRQWTAGIVIGLMAPFAVLYIPLLTPVITQIGKAQQGESFENKNDFSNEFYGWVLAAEKMLEWKKELESSSTTTKPATKVFLGAQRYELVSQLTWALQRLDIPVRLSPELSQEVKSEAEGNQSIFLPSAWTIANESNAFYYQQFKKRSVLWGRDFILVNNDKYPRNPMDFAKFDSCEKREVPIFRKPWSGRSYSVQVEHSLHVRTFYIYHCKNLQEIYF